VYGFLAPSPELPRSPDVWQTFDITLIGRRVTVVQNGTTIIDKQEIPGITGGAVDSHEAAPGPIYLQGSEKGHVTFRNIVITPSKCLRSQPRFWTTSFCAGSCLEIGWNRIFMSRQLR
jgi:hypothetical protein